MGVAHETGAWDAEWPDRDEHDGPDGRDHLTVAADAVEVRRHGSLAAVLGGVAAALAIAYLGRATTSGAVLDWTIAVALGLVSVGYLRSFLDARTPLLVADQQGVRIRLGRTWQGLPWGALKAVEHRPRRSLLRDGRLALVPHNPDRVLAELDSAGARHVRVSQRLYGAPFALPLGLTTRVAGVEGDLTEALTRLAGDEGTAVVEPAPVEPEPEPEAEAGAEPSYDEEAEPTPSRRRLPDPRPMLARLVASATPAPTRETIAGQRVDTTSTTDEAVAEDDATTYHVLGDDDVPLSPHEEWDDRVRPIASVVEVVEPLVIDDFVAEPAEDPVIGPELAASRTRLALTVDQLAERTRIRPHVIESIEVDDFAPCGGDFYARGHLRTLARVLGVDAEPLLTQYDDRYADAPINARRVFEAELATGAGGSIRSTRGGPNWSVLVAAVMTLVLVWSIARLLMDTPVELQQPAPVLNGSAGVGNGNRTAGTPTSVVLKSVAGGATVTVRDGSGEVVFTGDIAHGATEEFDAVPPVRVESSDAGAVEIHVDGKNRGTLGKSGTQGRGTFIVR